VIQIEKLAPNEAASTCEFLDHHTSASAASLRSGSLT
jgi:hypothetical protein